MKRTLVLFAVLAATASPAQARTWDQIKSSGTIKIATEGAFKPFNYFEGKTLTGFEVELGNAIAKQLGMKVQWVTQPFDGLLIGLNQDRYDFVIASHGITPERQKAVDFSAPHYCTGGLIVSKTGGPKTAKDLSGKIVAVQVGTTYLDNVKKVAGVKSVKTYPKDTDAQQAIMMGRADAWVSDKFLAIDAIKANPGKLQQGDLLFQERIGMAVKKGNASLLKELNTTLQKLQGNGTYAKISGKYFGQDIRCK
ncbi:ABC transporter substrate-binding protein [Deinococcus maricopensis]|uniref:ABC-type transporter, periplasmic subunit family 3 n=1 Tax=Deinococcus maricopensis (strain DSM 21211 / LMG 22137 / NRRL B-23946 / LB-34) TaxID=709986 RepID=E8U917_DEIML|nr:ABC transporter substrate-binding protein [Deinococcus maricopensis]ADV67556.1 ABC-type transporter, periplasmic subunit family 3 [Deinococcus maricopensis DSM 21211]